MIKLVKLLGLLTPRIRYSAVAFAIAKNAALSAGQCLLLMPASDEEEQATRLRLVMTEFAAYFCAVAIQEIVNETGRTDAEDIYRSILKGFGEMPKPNEAALLLSVIFHSKECHMWPHTCGYWNGDLAAMAITDKDASDYRKQDWVISDAKPLAKAAFALNVRICKACGLSHDHPPPAVILQLLSDGFMRQLAVFVSELRGVM